MKIGIVGPNAAPGKIGGLETLFTNLLDALGTYDKSNSYRVYLSPVYNRPLRLAYNFELVTPAPYLKYTDRLNPKIYRSSGYRSDTALRNYYEAEPVDILHFPFTTIHPLGVKKLKVLTFADLQQEYYPEFFDEAELRHRRFAYKPSAQEADHVISISQYTRQGLLEKYGLPPDKVTTVYLSYNQKLFKPGKPTADSPYLFYPAGSWKHKNHARLIEAFSEVSKRYPRLKLRLSGTVQTQDQSIRSQVKQLGLTDRIDFIGHVSDQELPALFQGAIGLVFPSLFEGFGIPVLEAMASGCPVACSNTTSLPEVAGEAAIYFNPEKVTEISNAMITLLENQKLRDDLRKRGLQRVKEFDSQHMANEIVQIYKKVTGGVGEYTEAFG